MLNEMTRQPQPSLSMRTTVYLLMFFTFVANCSDSNPSQPKPDAMLVADAMAACVVSIDDCESTCEGTTYFECDDWCPLLEMNARERAARDCSLMANRTSIAGTCGEYRYVRRRDEFSYVTNYFELSGALVGGEAGTDISNYCSDTSFSISYGLVPDCNLVPDEDLCSSSE